MARFIPDPISGLPWRPYKSEDEIDGECESCLRQWFNLSPESPIPLPITTDLLTVMIEEHAEQLDLYANMATEVQGLTTISAAKRPFVRINRQLSTASHRTNRLRSTLAHEFYHLGRARIETPPCRVAQSGFGRVAPDLRVGRGLKPTDEKCTSTLDGRSA
jgi:hypothetical protein